MKINSEHSIKKSIVARSRKSDTGSTERKKAEQPLRENQEDLNRAQAVAHTGSWRLNVQRNELVWSDETHRIFGIPKGIPMTYEMFLAAVHPDDCKFVDQKWKAALAGEPYDIEHRIIVKGDIKWVRERAELEFDRKGKLLGGFGTAQDITERKQAEQKTVWLASFPLLNPNPIVELDLQGNITFANPGASRLFRDLRKKGMSHPLLKGILSRMKSLKKEKEKTITRQIEAGGLWFSQTISFIQEQNKIRVYSTDITKEKQLEKLLKEINETLEKKVMQRTSELTRASEAVKLERQRLYNVLEMLPAYVVLLTPDYHVPFVNRFFRERFGESHGRRCFEYLFKRSEPCEPCETYKVLKTNSPHHWEWIGPDGRNYDIFDFPFTDVDGSTLIMEMGIDITERKRAQEELLKAQKELNDAKRLSDIGTLAATIAHELRNPLAAIKMAGYNIKRKAPNSALDKHLLNIETKLAESEQIISNLLFYSKIKMPHYGNINIHNILNACIKEAASQFSKYSIEVEKRIEPIKDLLIEADPVQAKEVFSNILNNAFDALEEHRGRIEIEALCNNETVKVLIKDSGVGIAKEDLEKVFEPFFTTKAKGTGLGLAVCQQIVHLHGGSIHIKSEKGKGTAVAIILPIKQKKNA